MGYQICFNVHILVHQNSHGCHPRCATCDPILLLQSEQHRMITQDQHFFFSACATQINAVNSAFFGFFAITVLVDTLALLSSGSPVSNFFNLWPLLKFQMWAEPSSPAVTNLRVYLSNVPAVTFLFLPSLSIPWAWPNLLISFPFSISHSAM